MTCDIKRVQFMASLKEFWSFTIKNGEELMIEPPNGRHCVITEVSIADDSEKFSRSFLSAHVETLPPDDLVQNVDAPSIDSDVVLAVFTAFSPKSLPLHIVFAQTDLAYLQANGCALAISGYTIPKASL